MKRNREFVVFSSKENDSDTIISSKYKRLDVHDDKRTGSYDSKFGSPSVSQKKFIDVKIKKGSMGPDPKKRNRGILLNHGILKI